MYPRQVYLVQEGQPLTVNGRVVGAAAVAGLPQGEEDQAVEAGIAAWQQMRPGAAGKDSLARAPGVAGTGGH